MAKINSEMLSKSQIPQKNWQEGISFNLLIDV